MDTTAPSNKTQTEENCSPSRCVMNGDDESHLLCVLCKRKVHFECSDLPAYEIHRLTSSSVNSFKCINCVRVPKSLTKRINEHKAGKINKELKEKETTIQKLRQELSIKTNARDIIKNDLESFLTKKMEYMETRTREIIKEEFTTKSEEANQTYANITKIKQIDIKSIVKEQQQEQQQEEQREEMDIRSREKNIILHGVFEGEDETDEEVSACDTKEVIKLFTNIFGADEKHIFKNFKTAHERIGKKSSDKNRPLKVTFFDQKHKERVMSHLHRIKINAPSYKISVTEDFTMTERMKIREKYEIAKKRNEEMSEESKDFIWRVKGSPRKSFDS